jgi:hypothetical protein
LIGWGCVIAASRGIAAGKKLCGLPHTLPRSLGRCSLRCAASVGRGW